MMQVVEKLYKQQDLKDVFVVFAKFIEFMKWSEADPARKDLIRTRITQIANQNDANETPQHVLSDLERLDTELERREVEKEEEDEFALKVPKVEGFIAQGTESVKEFRENIQRERYKEKRHEGIERLFSNILEGHAVYVIPAIVKGPEDFVLGHRDIKNKRIYVTEEVLYVLRRAPPEESNRLLREYLWHEVHENPSKEKDHYQLIAQQQVLFNENYKDFGYEEVRGGLGFSTPTVLVDKKTKKIGKGLLGEKLRFVIDGALKNRGPFNSVKAALKNCMESRMLESGMRFRNTFSTGKVGSKSLD
jgi:hypothetical protein